MDINEAIKEALADYMRSAYEMDVDRVDSWEDTTISSGYCSTCYYEYAGVEVWYYNSKGERVYWEYRDSFASLVSNL